MSKKKIICEIMFVGAILIIMGGLQTNFGRNSTNLNKGSIVTPQQASTDPTAFISTWNTSITSSHSSNSTSITLPLVSSGTYNFTVQWGDGNSSIVTSYNSVNATHNYGAQGVYTLNIIGELSGWSFAFANGGDRLKILDISQWGSMNLGNSQDYFMNCSNLVLTATDALNLTGTTDLYRTFEYCPNLGSAGNMDGWNVSKVISMQNMFYGATSFNQSIENWDVSKVINMANMFYNASAFNQPIGNWNVSKVTQMQYMFAGDSSFNQPIGNWNVSSVTYMGAMFQGASAFNQTIGNWDVSKINNMANMFYGASAFNQPIGNWNVSSINNMPYMFYGASAFNQPIGNWNVSNVNYMGSMFQGAIAFNRSIDNWNVSNVINMVSMFQGASSFNQNISSWDVSNVTYMNYMFYGASAFNQPIGNWNVSKVTQMPYMFYGASAFNQPLNNWNVSSVTYMGAMFQGASAFNQPIGNWDVSKVTNMDSMFWSASTFNQSLNNWNVSSVTTIARMFYGASAFNQNIGSWNVSSATEMTNMFNGSALSSENYGYLLIGWSQLTLKSNVQFSAGSTQYWAGTPAIARQNIIDTYHWAIADGGLANSSTPVLSPITSPSTTGTITLSWSPSISTISYMVYRSTSIITTISSATMIAFNITVTTYKDTNLADGTYYYVIVATNGVVNSSISNCENVTVISKPSAPTNLNATAETTYISLTWETPTNIGGSTILHYNIYRSTSVNGSFILIGTSTITSYNDTNATTGQMYYYEVSAINNAGESSYSTTANATIITPKSSNSNIGWIIFGVVAGVIIAGGIVSYVYLQKNPEKRDLVNEKLTPIKQKASELYTKSKQKSNELINKLKEKINKTGVNRDPSKEEQ